VVQRRERGEERQEAFLAPAGQELRSAKQNGRNRTKVRSIARQPAEMANAN